MDRTPLTDHLEHGGASIRSDEGVRVAARVADAAAEQRALRDAAGVVDLGFRTILVARGDDHVEFLQGMLTNDVAHLAVGEGRPALLLTIQGRVTADVDVLRMDDALWLIVDRRVADETRAALEKLVIADDVTLELAADQTLLAVIGPGAPPIFDGAAPAVPWRHVATAIDDVPVRLLRGTPLAADDVLVCAPVADAPRVWDALVARGAVPCGLDAFEARRIALGVPRIGVDMGASTLAIEMPLEARISATKGCYLGQEVVARGTSRGKVNRRLCGLVFTGAAPAAGTPLLWDGREVGTVTSVSGPPVLPTSIGLGLVRREHWEAGTELDFGTAAGETVARVAAWPLA